MKRLLIAAAMALAIHGSFLVAEPEWLKQKILEKAEPRPVTMTLAYNEPRSPEISSKKSVNVPKKDKQERSAGKSPQKKIPEPLKPVKSLSQLAPAPDQGQPETVQESTDHLPDSTKQAPQEQGLDAGEKEVLTPPVRITNVLRQTGPTYRRNPAPRYPRLAKKMGYQGTVVLDVLVGRMGIVEKLRVFESSGYPLLDKAAKTSVSKWQFEPGVRGDKKVEMWVKVPVRFELK
ncbi:MAG: energy transducer TonB [Thermodesulfobacteriota bacterium]|nr:energy transducer TonB [Thermodesulfobacteriota bacterium]